MNKDGHFVIGLTGSIGAGKSLVRKMLMHKGAMGLDADLLAHDSYAKGAPAYDALVSHFGSEILDAGGNINRLKLGKHVFGWPDDLNKLEEIVHPFVHQAAQNLVNHSTLPIVVIEAIKLLESDLVALCDSIWVVEAPQEKILTRLEKARGISPSQIEERLAQQSSSEAKRRHADVLINNSGTISATWDELDAHWNGLVKNDEKFQVLEGDMQSLQSPFRDILIHPSLDRAEQLADWLDQEPTSWSSRLSSSMNGVVNGGAMDRTEKVQKAFHLLCEFFFARTLKMDGLDGLTWWKMQHLALHVAWIPFIPILAENKMKFTLEMIEAFARLNLCKKVTLPVPVYARELVESLDYHAQVDRESSEFEIPASGYNQYEKILEPVMDLFKIIDE